MLQENICCEKSWVVPYWALLMSTYNICFHEEIRKNISTFIGKYQYFSVEKNIMKTCLFKYIENFTSKNIRISDKKTDIFHISAQNIDCGYSLELPKWGTQNIDCEYSLEPPQWGSSNEYLQSIFLSRNKKNYVYPFKPQFYYIKVGFKGVKV